MPNNVSQPAMDMHRNLSDKLALGGAADSGDETAANLLADTDFGNPGGCCGPKNNSMRSNRMMKGDDDGEGSEGEGENDGDNGNDSGGPSRLLSMLGSVMGLMGMMRGGGLFGALGGAGMLASLFGGGGMGGGCSGGDCSQRMASRSSSDCNQRLSARSRFMTGTNGVPGLSFIPGYRYKA